MNMGSCIQKKTYIQECTVEDHIALSVIQELKSCVSDTYFLMASVFAKLMLLLNMYVPCKETVNLIFRSISVNSMLYECELNLLL